MDGSSRSLLRIFDDNTLEEMEKKCMSEIDVFMTEFPHAYKTQVAKAAFLNTVNIVIEQLRSTHAILRKEGGEKNG